MFLFSFENPLKSHPSRLVISIKQTNFYPYILVGRLLTRAYVPIITIRNVALIKRTSPAHLHPI